MGGAGTLTRPIPPGGLQQRPELPIDSRFDVFRDRAQTVGHKWAAAEFLRDAAELAAARQTLEQRLTAVADEADWLMGQPVVEPADVEP